MRVEHTGYLSVNGTRVVALGNYRGRARADETVVDGAFAHVIDVPGERVAALRQSTDPARPGVPAPT